MVVDERCGVTETEARETQSKIVKMFDDRYETQHISTCGEYAHIFNISIYGKKSVHIEAQYSIQKDEWSYFRVWLRHKSVFYKEETTLNEIFNMMDQYIPVKERV